MLYQLAFPVAGQVIHHHEDLTCANGQIHRPANRRNRVGRAGAPVRQIAAGGNLIGAEHADIEMAAAHHGEGVAVVEIAAALQQSHILFSGVNQLRVLFARPWLWPHSQQAVFAVQEDFFIGRKVVGDTGG